MSETRTSKRDRNWTGFGDGNGPFILENETVTPPDPENWDDILKLSNASNVLIKNCDINPHGGNREDGVDINRYCDNVKIVDCRVGSGKKYHFTIKGACSNIYLSNVVLHGRGKEGVDIDIGNYSDTTMKKTTNVTLINVTREDGKPVTLRVGLGKRVFVFNSRVKKLRLQSIGLKLYCWGKYALVKLGLIGWKE